MNEHARNDHRRAEDRLRRDQRHDVLVELITERDTARVDDLARRLGVSVATVRRDLQHLEGAGRLNRVLGGARGVSETAWAPRAQSHVAEKRRIAAEAAKLVGPRETLALETGTTVVAVAAALPPGELTVVTTSVDVLIEMQARHDVNLILSGGAFDPLIRSLHGPLVERFYAEHKVDRLFLGAGSVGIDGLRDSYLDAIASKRVAIAAARQTIVVADSSKFNQSALMELTAWDAISTLVTDDGAPAASVAAIRDQGVEVIVA